LDLDLRSSIHFYMTHSSSMGSPVSTASTDGCCIPNLRSRINAWPTHAMGSFSLSGMWRPRSPPSPSFATTFGGSRQHRRFLLMRGYHSAARGSHALSVMAPIPPSSIATVYLMFMFLYLFFFLVYFWAFLSLYLPHVHLCLNIWLCRALYTTNTTLTSGLDF